MAIGLTCSLIWLFVFTGDQCGGEIFANKTISTPRFPQPYHNGLTCSWKLTAPQYAYFKIEPLHFSIGSVVRMRWLSFIYELSKVRTHR